MVWFTDWSEKELTPEWPEKESFKRRSMSLFSFAFGVYGSFGSWYPMEWLLDPKTLWLGERRFVGNCWQAKGVPRGLSDARSYGHGMEIWLACVGTYAGGELCP